MIGPRLSIDEIYQQRRSVWSDIVDHLPTLHAAVIDSNAQTVVELGVRSGNSTTALLAAVARTGGHLWSVDIRLMPSASYDALRRAADDQWTFILGDDMTVADQIDTGSVDCTTIRDAEPRTVPLPIDVLFIDSSHHYEHTLAELRLYGPRADVILLHDTELEHPDGAPSTDPPFPVKRAIEAYCAETGRPWTNATHCYGLGTIRR